MKLAAGSLFSAFVILLGQASHASTTHLVAADPIEFHNWCDSTRPFAFCQGEFQELCKTSLHKVTTRIQNDCSALHGIASHLSTTLDANPPSADNYLAGYSC